MKVADISLTEECFTHLDEVTGEQTTWAASRLRKRAEELNLEMFLIPVEEHHAEFCVNKRGVEPDRLTSLLEGGADVVTKPIVFVHMPDGTHLLIDGTHRYVIFYAMKLPHIKAYIVPYDIAKEFIVEDMPQTTEELLMQHSGMTLLRRIFGEHE